MNGALLLAATMKDNERITLRFKGDGPIGEVVADAEGTNVRGYVENPDVFLPLLQWHTILGSTHNEGCTACALLCTYSQLHITQLGYYGWQRYWSNQCEHLFRRDILLCTDIADSRDNVEALCSIV